MAEIFNITERRAQNTSINGKDYIYAYDTGHGSSISQDTPPKDFTITVHDTSSWLLPCESMLDLTFKTQVSPNGISGPYSDITVAMNAPSPALILGDITQIFEKASLSIGGVVVEELSSECGIVKHVEHLVDMTAQYRDTAGTLLMSGDDPWYDNNDTVSAGALFDEKGSLTHKCAILQGSSNKVRLSIPLPLLFNTFKYYTKVMTGVPIQVDLKIRPDNQYFKRWHASDATKNYGRIVWIDRGLELKLCRVTPSLTFRSKLQELREKDTQIHLDGYHSQVNVIDFVNNPSDVVQEVTCRGATTIKYAMVFFKNKKRLDSSALNVAPGLLDNFSIKNIGVSLNGDKWRQRDYFMKWPADLYGISAPTMDRGWQDPYTELMKHAGTMASPVDNSYQGQCTLSYESYAKYPVYVFDLSRSESKVIPNSNSLTVNFTRDNSDTDHYRMYVVTYFPKTVHVNLKSGNVSTSTAEF